MCITTLIGTILKFGTSSILNYILTLLIFIVSTMIIKPKYTSEANEKRKLGIYVIISTQIAKLITIFFGTVYIYDILASIMFSVMSYIFYKIFVNAMPFIIEYNQKKVFSIEEIIGASLIFEIAITSLGDINILGFSIRNILSILIVLILGWQNGIVVGAGAGVTIGTVLAICTNAEPITIAAFALSGLISGILNKFGKIGVAVGFALGSILVGTWESGNTEQIIMLKEILIASIGLLAMPKLPKISIEDIYGNTNLLPVNTGMELEETSETINKLNSMSETISEIAKTYKAAAATIVDRRRITKTRKRKYTKL